MIQSYSRQYVTPDLDKIKNIVTKHLTRGKVFILHVLWRQLKYCWALKEHKQWINVTSLKEVPLNITLNDELLRMMFVDSSW